MASVGFLRSVRNLSTLSLEKHCKILIIGGGTGGATMAANFAPKFSKNEVIVLEPQEYHYYQPMWTLVGAGLKTFEESRKPTASIIHPKALLLRDSLQTFDPENNCVFTKQGTKISYDILIVSMGLKIRFDQIPGLTEALETTGVCSNYSAETVKKTTQALNSFQGGNALFTQPNTPIKCAGAPQKIMYLADAFLRKAGKRDSAKISFVSGMGAMFSVPLYAASLVQVAKKKDIDVHLQHNLVQVDSLSREAIFEMVSSTETPKQKIKIKYDFLHVTPPMSPPDELKKSPLVDASGFLTVHKETLQHIVYKNIFGIGDCTNLPTSKTAAAIAGQSGALKMNIASALSGKELTGKYNGYTSCPLLTNYGRCIMAEFDYDLKPMETFPFDQSKERILPYYLKKDLMPVLYWNWMLRGYWEGPATLRKILHFGKV